MSSRDSQTGRWGGLLSGLLLCLLAGSGSAWAQATVTVTVLDPVAVEPGADPASFTLSRGGDTAAALPVFYSLGGSATFGADYTVPPTFSVTSQISVPVCCDAGSGPGNPYPSQLVVGGLSGTITKVTVTLDGLRHGFPEDLDVLLVGPGGQRVLLMSDAGGGTPVDNVTLTFADDAPVFLTSAPLATGTVRPTNLPEGRGDGDVFPGPAPGGPYGTSLGVFNGTDPNGTWQLFVRDDCCDQTGTLFQWRLTITTSVQTLVAVIQPGASSVSVQVVPVNDGPGDPGETVVLTLQPGPGYVVDAPSNATATIFESPVVTTGSVFPGLVSEAAATPATITLTRQGDLSVALPVNYSFSGSALQDVDFFVRPPSFTVRTGIGVPDLAPATPYPSPIVVSGMPGSVTDVTVSLNSLTHTFPADVDVLLVGPEGQRVLLMAGAGGGTPVSGVTLTFDDDAAGPIPPSSLATGTFRPASYVSRNLPAPAPLGPHATALSAFEGTNPNGTWQLFVADQVGGDQGSLAGWTLTVTTTVQSSVAVFQAGDASAFVTVVPIPDATLEPDELATLTIEPGAGYIVRAPATATVTITDDPLVSVFPTDSTATETPPTPGVFTFSRVGDTAGPLTIVFSLTGNATKDTDYTLSPDPAPSGQCGTCFAIVIPAAQASVQLTVNPIGDLDAEVQEFVQVSIQSSPDYIVGSGFASVQILDQANVVTVFAADPTASEIGFDFGLFSITRQGDLSADLTVNFTIGGTATAGADYTALPAFAVIAAGQSSVSLFVTPIPDTNQAEGSETVTLTLEAGAGYGVGAPSTATVTIADDSGFPLVTVLATDPEASETGGNTGAFTVSRAGNLSQTLSVAYSLGGTATQNLDYVVPVELASTTPILVPEVGSANPYPSTIVVSGLSGTVTKVTVQLNGVTHVFPSDLDVLLVAPPQGLAPGPAVLLMSDAGGASAVTGVTLTFDDDATAFLTSSQLVSGTVRPTNLDGGDEDAFPGPAPAGPHGASLSVFNGINPNGTWRLFVRDDCCVDAGSLAGWTLTIATTTPPAQNTVVFQAGQSSATVRVSPLGDALSEGNETVQIALLAGAGYVVGTPSTATVTIAEPSTEVVTVETATPTIAEAGGVSGTFTVRRTGNLATNLTVFFSLGGTATNGVDYTNGTPATPVPASVTIPAGQASAAVSIFPVPDGTADDGETVILSLTGGAGYVLGPLTQLSATITLRDLTVVGVVASRPAASELELLPGVPNTGEFTLTRVGALGTPLTVDIQLGGTATIGLDYQVNLQNTTQVVFAPGQSTRTITVTPLPDSQGNEGTETVVLTIQPNPALYVSAPPAAATVEIADSRITVTVAVGDASASEAGPNTGTFVVTRAGDLSAALDVFFTLAGTAVPVVDYVPIAPSVRIPAGQASATVTVTPVPDLVEEGNETVVLTLLPDPSYALGATVAATLVIQDAPPPRFLLTVTKIGSGAGTVNSDPVGIACGDDCTQLFDQNRVVTLIPVPVLGASVFAGWSGHPDCSDESNPRGPAMVTIDQPKTCTARFEARSELRELTVTRTGTGGGAVARNPLGLESCGADCERHVRGEMIALLPASAPGSAFAGFGGENPDCADGLVTVNEDTACTAEFSGLSPGGRLDGRNPAVSDDGRLVVIESAATTLDPACPTPVSQIYLLDRLTGTFRCVSRDGAGNPGTGPSTEPSISGDGRLVAFRSSAPNLVPGCTVAGDQVLVRDLQTLVTECASVGPGGIAANAASGAPALSRDGRSIAFHSDGDNLDPDRCANGVRHVYVRRRDTATTECVSVTAAGVPGNLASAEPAISRDGGVVAFQSNATVFQGSGCAAGGQHVFVWDRGSQAITCASRAPGTGGAPADAASGMPALSDDGNVLVFESDARNLTADCTNGVRQVYLLNRAAQSLRCLSRTADGTPGDAASTDAAVSGNGLVVAFSTAADNLVGVASAAASLPGVHAQVPRIPQIVRTNSTVQNSVAQLMSQSQGSPGNGGSVRPALNLTGRVTAFQTKATNLVQGDTDDGEDVVIVADDPIVGDPVFTDRVAITAPLNFSQVLLDQPRTIRFEWSAFPGAARYAIEHTGQNLSFTNPGASGLDPLNGAGVFPGLAGPGGLVFPIEATSQTVTVGPGVPPGSYQVRIFALSPSSQVLGFASDALTLILGQVPAAIAPDAQAEITAPASGTPLARGGPVRIEWTPVAGVVQYVLEVSRPGIPFGIPNATVLLDPAVLSRIPAGGPPFQATVPPDLPAGAYQVRVIGLSAAGLPVGRFSDAVTLIVP